MTRYQVKKTYLWAALVVLDLNAFPNYMITLWVFRKLLWTARTELDCTIIFLVFLMMKVSSTTMTVFCYVWTVFEEEFVWWRNGLGFCFEQEQFWFWKWVKVAQNIVFLLNKTLYLLSRKPFFNLPLKFNLFVLWGSPLL